jgi:hypothetical protein
MTDDPGGSDLSPNSLDNPAPDPGSRLDTTVIAVGSGLVVAAVVLSAFYSRGDGDLDWSNYSMGIVATLGLLGTSGLTRFLAGVSERSAVLIAWPGALGAVGAGLMVGVGMDEGDATFYVAGALVVLVSVGGYYYLARHGAFVLSTIAGLLVLYANLYDDVVGTEINGGSDDNFGMLAAAAILLFAVAVTAAGWALPSRDLSAVTVGFAAIAGNLMVLSVLFAFTMVEMLFGELDQSMDDGFDPSGNASFEPSGRELVRFDKFDNDVWVILLASLVLCAGWAWCHRQTGHVGYRLLILANLVTVIPASTLVLAVEHPTYWELAVGVLGAAALAFAGVRAIGGPAGLRRLKGAGAG